MLSSDGNANAILSRARVKTFLLAELLMGCRPWVDCQGLGVSNTNISVRFRPFSKLWRGVILCKVGNQLEAVHKLDTGSSTAFNTERKDSTKPTSQVPFGSLMAWVAFQSRVGNPADVFVLLEPVCKNSGVAGMSLSAQTQGLQAQQKLLRSKGVQCRSEVTQDLNTNTDGKGDWSECFPEFQTMVSRRWLNKLWESSSILAPVKLATIDDHTTNGGTMSSNPFSCTVDDNVRAVVYGAAEVATSSKCVINLKRDKGQIRLRP